MRSRSTVLLAAGVLAIASAHAQHGRVQPLPGGVTYYGPAEPQFPLPTHRYTPGIGEAPEWIAYMSPRCSGLNDALRTASARGLDATTQNEMRRNYQRECGDNESEARSQFFKDKGEKRMVARSEQEAERRSVERSKLQAQQCDESKRILITKKRRTDLTDGEKADLQRFEANYHGRCG